ncbi:MAG: Cytidylate kinase [candidate division WS2 bacterium]|nr:Cytidylate kinase [Candidatus Lithacetigena glycinireducens]
MIITIDGPAGTGKSTVSRLLAERLSYPVIYSGLYYRAIAAYLIQEELLVQVEVIKAIENIVVKSDKEVKVNGKDVSSQLRAPEVDRLSSKISQLLVVREKVGEVIKKEAKNYEGLVAEGRDMGSVVFKDADLKVYLDASLSERAHRRYLEDVGEGNLNLDEVLAEIRKRDEEDSQRKISPLIIPSDAFYIDTTEMEVNQVVEVITNKITQLKVKGSR